MTTRRIASPIDRFASDSLADFCALVPHQGPRWTADNSQNWLFGRGVTLAMYKQRMAEGWEGGAQLIDQLASAILVPPPADARRRLAWADQGDSLDIHRVYRGQLATAWQRPSRRTSVAPRTVRVVAMISGKSSDDHMAFAWRGAMVLRLCDILVQHGYSVEVVGACVAQNWLDHYSGASYVHTFPIKAATAPLDVAMLAAVLCQPGFVRYAMFRAMQADGNAASYCGIYASNEVLNDLAAGAVPEDGVPTIVGAYHTYSNAETSATWLRGALASLQLLDPQE